jgi:hypothetical protein
LMAAMATKATKKPRSPVTGKVFEAFIARLRADPQIDRAVCDRLEAALTSGQTINAASLKNALFPERGGDDE